MCKHTLLVHTDATLGLYVDDGFMYTAAADGSAKQLDIASLTILRSFGGQKVRSSAVH